MIKVIIIVANTSKGDTQVTTLYPVIYSIVLSSCNIRLQERTMPSNQIAFNSAL